MYKLFVVAAALAFTSVLGIPAYAGEGCGDSHADKTSATEDSVKTIDTTGLQEAISDGKALTIVDARSAKWDDGKRIPGAIALTSDATDEEIAAALPDKDAEIVTYCSNLKCQASHQLSEKLQKLGYQKVVRYPDGIQGWTEAGQKIVETTKAAAPQS